MSTESYHKTEWVCATSTTSCTRTATFQIINRCPTALPLYMQIKRVPLGGSLTVLVDGEVVLVNCATQTYYSGLATFSGSVWCTQVAVGRHWPASTTIRSGEVTLQTTSISTNAYMSGYSTLTKVGVQLIFTCGAQSSAYVSTGASNTYSCNPPIGFTTPPPTKRPTSTSDCSSATSITWRTSSGLTACARLTSTSTPGNDRATIVSDGKCPSSQQYAYATGSVVATDYSVGTSSEFIDMSVGPLRLTCRGLGTSRNVAKCFQNLPIDRFVGSSFTVNAAIPGAVNTRGSGSYYMDAGISVFCSSQKLSYIGPSYADITMLQYFSWFFFFTIFFGALLLICGMKAPCCFGPIRALTMLVTAVLWLPYTPITLITFARFFVELNLDFDEWEENLIFSSIFPPSGLLSLVYGYLVNSGTAIAAGWMMVFLPGIPLFAVALGENNIAYVCGLPFLVAFQIVVGFPLFFNYVNGFYRHMAGTAGSGDSILFGAFQAVRTAQLNYKSDLYRSWFDFFEFTESDYSQTSCKMVMKSLLGILLTPIAPLALITYPIRLAAIPMMSYPWTFLIFAGLVSLNFYLAMALIFLPVAGISLPYLSQVPGTQFQLQIFGGFSVFLVMVVAGMYNDQNGAPNCCDRFVGFLYFFISAIVFLPAVFTGTFWWSYYILALFVSGWSVCLNCGIRKPLGALKVASRQQYLTNLQVRPKTPLEDIFDKIMIESHLEVERGRQWAAQMVDQWYYRAIDLLDVDDALLSELNIPRRLKQSLMKIRDELHAKYPHYTEEVVDGRTDLHLTLEMMLSENDRDVTRGHIQKLIGKLESKALCAAFTLRQYPASQWQEFDVPPHLLLLLQRKIGGLLDGETGGYAAGTPGDVEIAMANVTTEGGMTPGQQIPPGYSAMVEGGVAQTGNPNAVGNGTPGEAFGSGEGDLVEEKVTRDDNKEAERAENMLRGLPPHMPLVELGRVLSKSYFVPESRIRQIIDPIVAKGYGRIWHLQYCGDAEFGVMARRANMPDVITSAFRTIIDNMRMAQIDMPIQCQGKIEEMTSTDVAFTYIAQDMCWPEDKFRRDVDILMCHYFSRIWDWRFIPKHVWDILSKDVNKNPVVLMRIYTMMSIISRPEEDGRCVIPRELFKVYRKDLSLLDFLSAAPLKKKGFFGNQDVRMVGTSWNGETRRQADGLIDFLKEFLVTLLEHVEDSIEHEGQMWEDACRTKNICPHLRFRLIYFALKGESKSNMHWVNNYMRHNDHGTWGMIAGMLHEVHGVAPGMQNASAPGAFVRNDIPGAYITPVRQQPGGMMGNNVPPMYSTMGGVGAGEGPGAPNAPSAPYL